MRVLVGGRASGCAGPTTSTGRPRPGLDGFCSGLADALHGTGVRLLLVRPGFVIGRMTEGMSPAPFSSTPAQVADATVRALRKARDARCGCRAIAAAGVRRDADAAAVRVAEDAAMIRSSWSVSAPTAWPGLAAGVARRVGAGRQSFTARGASSTCSTTRVTAVSAGVAVADAARAAHAARRTSTATCTWSPAATRCCTASAATLIRLYGADQVAVLPHVSSVTLACSRVGWAVQDTEVISLVTARTAHRGASRRAGRRAVPRRQPARRRWRGCSPTPAAATPS